MADERSTEHDDPRHADPGHADPGQADPRHTDPGHADPGHADPGHADPGHVDPRLEEVGDEGVMPGELVDAPGNMPGDQPETDRPPSPATSGYRGSSDDGGDGKGAGDRDGDGDRGVDD